MDDELKKLATAFYNSGKHHVQETFTIRDSDEEVVVTVTRTRYEEVKKGIRKLAESQSLVPYGSGIMCGACGGTGRL